MDHWAPSTAFLGLAILACAATGFAGDGGLGLFEAHGDVGAVGKPGSVVYDAKAGTYTVTGGGENMWFATDAFHFVWKKVSGDVSLAADIRFVGTGGNAHRKAALLIRQSLEPDAAYADAVVHGDGLTSLQYREERGGPTREIQSNVNAPRRLRIEKEGDYVSCRSRARASRWPRPGGSFKIRFAEPFFVGLGVCAHDNAVSETAVFSNVEMTTGGRSAGRRARAGEHAGDDRRSPPKDRRVVYQRPRALRGAELVARRQGPPLQPRRAPLRAAGRGRHAAADRHRLRHTAATTTTGSRPTGRNSRSATSRRQTASR